jgi:transposase
MFYVGLDIHSKFIQVCILRQDAKVVRNEKLRQLDQLVGLLRQIPGPFEVCYEVSCGYGRYFEVLSTLATRVVAAHAGKLRLIYKSKRKNDRVDAEKLAKLLILDLVPAVHVPAAQVRAWRELITFRRKLVEKRTRAKNGVRALLRSVGVAAPKKPGVWSKRGLAWLKGLEFSQPMHALQRDLLVQEIETMNGQVRKVETVLAGYAKDNVAIDQLRTIPGVGLRTAEAVVAFLDDPKRFGRAKSVGCYFGLVPCQDQSGPKNRLGHITRDGSATVRQLLTEAAWQGVRRSPTIKAFFERVQRDDPGRKRIALTATAHYLCRSMWAMLRDGTLWRETVQKTTGAEKMTGA